jgi:hypothetical protein
MEARCQARRAAPAGRRTRRPVKPRTVSVRQGLQIAHQRRAAAVELIQTLSGIAERDDVLHRLLVQTTVRIARRQPLACGGGVARRQIATHGDNCQRTRLHHCGLQKCVEDSSWSVQREGCRRLVTGLRQMSRHAPIHARNAVSITVCPSHFSVAIPCAPSQLAQIPAFQHPTRRRRPRCPVVAPRC